MVHGSILAIMFEKHLDIMVAHVFGDLPCARRISLKGVGVVIRALGGVHGHVASPRELHLEVGDGIMTLTGGLHPIKYQK